jgi:ABC-type Zn uptake system ZnuABC Zn-binding protein ZnuA
MVEEVVDALAEADPSHAVEYRRRGDAYREELQALDLEVRGLLAAVSRDRRVLVTTHDTFGYFAAEYGFEVLSVLESFSSEGGEPSAGELAAVIERIKARRVPAVFAENILDPRTTEKVAKEAGVAVVGTLYTDALGLPDTAGATYLGMMRHNARAIAEALR